MQHIDNEIFNLISDNDIEAEVINCEELRSEVKSLIVKLDAKMEALTNKARNQSILYSFIDISTVLLNKKTSDISH